MGLNVLEVFISLFLQLQHVLPTPLSHPPPLSMPSAHLSTSPPFAGTFIASDSFGPGRGLSGTATKAWWVAQAAARVPARTTMVLNVLDIFISLFDRRQRVIGVPRAHAT